MDDVSLIQCGLRKPILSTVEGTDRFKDDDNIRRGNTSKREAPGRERRLNKDYSLSGALKQYRELSTRTREKYLL